MPADGAEQVRALALRLRAAGEGGMWRQVAAALREGASPLPAAANAVAEQRLPQSGGLAALVAGRRTTISVRTGVATTGVRLVKKDSASKQTNAGHIYHRTFGEDTEVIPWKRQELPDAKGWWTDTLAELSPGITPVLIGVMTRVGEEIQGR